MRDANGAGNIYFDDFFSNGIPFSSLIYWILNGTIGFMNLLATPIFFYYACVQQSYHTNLKLVTSNIYLAFFLCSLGNLVYSTLVLMRVSDRENEIIFGLFGFIQGLRPSLLEAVFIMITVERSIATIFAKDYENKAPILLGLILYFSEFLGVLTPTCYYFARLNVLTISIIGTVFNLICYASIFILFWSNKKLWKIKFDATIHLSYRYQLTENLRFLRIMIPIIVSFGAFQAIVGAIYLVQTSINFATQLYYPCYEMAANLYTTFYYAFYLLRDRKIRQKILNLFCQKTSIVVPKNDFFKNVMEEPIFIQNNAENHFKELDKYWT